MFRHYRVIFRELAFITQLDTNTQTQYVPDKHDSNTNIQSVYTATTQIDFVRTVTIMILFHIGQFQRFKDFINLNCITNSCNGYTNVTLRGNEYELSEDDTIVSKHVGA